MIRLHLADHRGLAAAQDAVAKWHYLHTAVDSRCSPVAYLVSLDAGHEPVIGCLIFGRPEATRLYQGPFTYGSLKDVQDGRCSYDRWEILNLARVWFDPRVQKGGCWYRSDLLPGYTNRHGAWFSTLASTAIQRALTRIGDDYLSLKPPVFVHEPYEIKAVLSYCDTRLHKGTIYRAAGFDLARVNERGIETYWTTNVTPLTPYQHDMVCKLAARSPRGIRLRSQRAMAQAEMSL